MTLLRSLSPRWLVYVSPVCAIGLLLLLPSFVYLLDSSPCASPHSSPPPPPPTYPAWLAPVAFPQLYECDESETMLLGEGRWHEDDFKGSSGEDRWLLRYVFGPMKGGTFVDVGAMDGRTNSVSWFFEMALGWRGLLVEGHPINQRTLRTSYRPNSVALSVAICDPATGPILNFTNRGGDIGAATAYASAAFLNASHPNDGFNDPHFPALSLSSMCTPLQALLDVTGLAEVDLLIVSVNGAELAVLSTVNFTATNVHVVVVTLIDAADAATLQALMARVGFVLDGPTHSSSRVFFFLNPFFVDRRRPPHYLRLVRGTGMPCR